MRCEEVRHRILEQTLEGTFAPTGTLAEHLHGCPACQEWQVRVHEVDLALRALPLDSVPAWRARQIVARVTAAGPQENTFMPWTFWVPVGSLLIGLFWAYATLVWPNGSDLIRSVDPTVLGWLAQFEQWVTTNQMMLGAVVLSVVAGVLFTMLVVGLGLYVGRDRMARHGHSH